MESWILAYLDETNVGRVLTETLTAHVQVVLADESSLMSANSALARAFSVFLGVGVPDSSVGHISNFCEEILARLIRFCHF